MPAIDIAERHFDVKELAQLWKLHPNTIRKIFERVPDVVKYSPLSQGKRRYTTVRIPLSVAERVYRALRGLGPRQTVTVERAAPKPLIDPSLTGLGRKQAEMRARLRKLRN